MGRQFERIGIVGGERHFMPRIQGGILFLEDVAEQPYRIERMLYTLHLAGILKQQQAIVLGDFRMGNIRDTYDSSFNFGGCGTKYFTRGEYSCLYGLSVWACCAENDFSVGCKSKFAWYGGRLFHHV